MLVSLGRIDKQSKDSPFAFFNLLKGDASVPELLNTIISNTYTFLTLVGGISFILYFVLGALNWVTASGKQDKVEKAKSMMTDATIGIIIIVLSYPIIYIIGRVLGLDILHPENIIPMLGPGE